MMTAKKIKKALRGEKLTFVNVEKILNSLGYSVVLFNTPAGDMEIERYNLEYEKNTLKAFTYSHTAHIVFINSALHTDDRLYLALHELGHIVLGHIGDGKVITRNQILIDIESDNFVYSIIHENKKNYLYILVVALALSSLLIVGIWVKTMTLPVNNLTESTEQQLQSVDTVYITPTGSKFHRKNCVHIKDKLIGLPRSEAVQYYMPCKTCNP